MSEGQTSSALERKKEKATGRWGETERKKNGTEYALSSVKWRTNG